ncbi:hypothetical protein B0H11DRAFT_786059 [Mycena galericulata]|nr:hypothetical protein B0H11DRAFT_786059 [Mycena galericulata]
MFLAPRLTAIEVVPGDSLAQLSLLPTLGMQYPDLIEVYIGGLHRMQFQPAVIQSISAFLLPLKRLRYLTLANLDAAIFEHASRLPALEILNVTELVGFDPLPGLDPEPRFPALESLALGSTTPEIAIKIIRSMHSRPLTFLELVYETAFPDMMTTTELYTALAARCSHSTLTAFQMQDEYIYQRTPDIPGDADFENYVVQPHTLRILFPFTNLTTIILKPYHGFKLDDAVVLEMAQVSRS